MLEEPLNYSFVVLLLSLIFVLNTKQTASQLLYYLKYEFLFVSVLACHENEAL